MIAYLPEIYPDELVYSWFCRYYIHSGCITHKMALQEILYKRCNNPSKEFIGHLNPDMLEKISSLYNIDDLILNHTMFPQYARFVSLEQRKIALFHIGHDFCDVHHLFPVLPRSDADRFLKYCPLCAVEDRKEYGEAYWHRKHQIRNMMVCVKHKCKLLNSKVEAKDEQDFTLSPAELEIGKVEPEIIENPLQLAYHEYLITVFDTPIDFENNIPVAAALYHHMSRTKYMKTSGKTRYTKQLADDMKAQYEAIGLSHIASMHQIQRVLLGNRFDFNVICQIAFFLGMPVDELTAPVLTATQIEQEQDSHYMKGKAPIDWNAYDDELAPMLEQIARDIYEGAASEIGRPERVSEKVIYRELELPKHRLDNLSKCKAIFEKYTESYAENWARKLIWAYRKLEAESNGKPFYWSDIREISGVKKKNIDKILPFLIKHTDSEMVQAIISKIGI